MDFDNGTSNSNDKNSTHHIIDTLEQVKTESRKDAIIRSIKASPKKIFDHLSSRYQFMVRQNTSLQPHATLVTLKACHLAAKPTYKMGMENKYGIRVVNHFSRGSGSFPIHIATWGFAISELILNVFELLWPGILPNFPGAISSPEIISLGIFLSLGFSALIIEHYRLQDPAVKSIEEEMFSHIKPAIFSTNKSNVCDIDALSLRKSLSIKRSLNPLIWLSFLLFIAEYLSCSMIDTIFSTPLLFRKYKNDADIPLSNPLLALPLKFLLFICLQPFISLLEEAIEAINIYIQEKNTRNTKPTQSQLEKNNYSHTNVQTQQDKQDINQLQIKKYQLAKTLKISTNAIQMPEPVSKIPSYSYTNDTPSNEKSTPSSYKSTPAQYNTTPSDNGSKSTLELTPSNRISSSLSKDNINEEILNATSRHRIDAHQTQMCLKSLLIDINPEIIASIAQAHNKILTAKHNRNFSETISIDHEKRVTRARTRTLSLKPFNSAPIPAITPSNSHTPPTIHSINLQVPAMQNIQEDNSPHTSTADNTTDNHETLNKDKVQHNHMLV